jgi:hypothetical protein
LSNYRVVAFIIDNPDENELTVKVKANTEGGTAENIPFLFKVNTDTEYEKIDARPFHVITPPYALRKKRKKSPGA